MVIINLHGETTQESLDQSNEMLKYYAQAPLTYILQAEKVSNLKIDPGLVDLTIQLGENEGETTIFKNDGMIKSYLNQAYEEIVSYEQTDVEPLFTQFDFDGDRTISIKELDECLKYLGHYLGPEELQKAIDGLDPTHHGKVHYEEFRTWFLNGQRSFNLSDR